MGHCQAASPFPTKSRRGAFWPLPCSPSSARRHLHPFPIRWESFNLRRLLTRTKTIEDLITELRFLTTAPFSPSRKKPYCTTSTASLMQPSTSASPSARRRLRCCANPSAKSVGLHPCSHPHRWHQPQRSGTLYLPG